MPETRDNNIEKIGRDGAFDVVVVGGGVNGIGVFRELALQGLRVLLVERNDYSSGCSAAPSRMIHGGLRYLENGEFDLVRESLHERDALLRNAPHLVRPLPTMIPLRSVWSGLLNGAAGFFGLGGSPSSRGLVPVRIGLAFYDWMTRHNRMLRRSSVQGTKRTFAQWPAIAPDFKFSAIYHDAWISYPERLCVELVRDTLKQAPDCAALNYAELARDEAGFTVTDRESNKSFKITAKAMVNATGAWLDDVAGLIDQHHKPKEQMVSGTKGSHIILDNPALVEALDGHMVLFDNTDGRVCILFPYLGRALAGSTDIRVEAPDRVRCETEERDYILDAVRQIFPQIEIGAENVVFSYSGIRPLPKSDHDFTGRISRGHFVRRLEGDPPQFCMVGGKWTTFRAFAEQTADKVLAELGQERTVTTKNLAIGGGAGFEKDQADLPGKLVETYGISVSRADYLVDHYGSDADAVQAYCAARADDEPLAPGILVTRAEIDFLIRHEFVHTLSDLVLRRTSLAITGQISEAVITAIAEVAAETLGWDAKRRVAETRAMISELDEFYGVSPEMLKKRTFEKDATCA